VALGFLTDGMVRQLIRDMVEDVLGYLPPHLHIEIFPCPPNSGCECRKPQPAMLLRIMSRCGVAGEETLLSEIWRPIGKQRDAPECISCGSINSIKEVKQLR